MSTKYNRWRPEERNHLFESLIYGLSYYSTSYCSFPKINQQLHADILMKLNKSKFLKFLTKKSKPDFYVHRIPYNYIKAFDFIPFFWNEVDGEKKSEDYKPYSVLNQEYASVTLAVFNSNLFFWWWYCLFEGYHCGKHEICNFPVNIEDMSSKSLKFIEELSRKLMNDLKKNKNRKECNYKNTGKVVYDEFFPKESKNIIDEIDHVLGRHHGFTEEEIDFIINYDIKYRMGIS